MLYHTTWITLYRPYIELEGTTQAPVPDHITDCIEHSRAARDSAELYCATFCTPLPYLTLFSSFVTS